MNLRSSRVVRRIWTRGFSSGLLALGEENLGAIDGRWVTVDWGNADFPVDLRSAERLPFGDASQRFIYSAHLIEHLDDATLRKLFAECHRLLGPGGWLRLETPDAERFVQAYRDGDREFYDYFANSNRATHVERLGLPESVLEPHNVLVGELSNFIGDGGAHIYPVVDKSEVDRQLDALSLDEFGAWCVSLQTTEQYRSGGHINCLHYGKLERMLGQAGFTNVSRQSNGRGSHPELLRNLERPHRAFYSVYVEGQRP